MVSEEVVPPYPDKPTEGFLKLAVELSPIASPMYEVRDLSSIVS